MYKIYYVSFDPNDYLYEENVIIPKMVASAFKSVEDAEIYIKTLMFYHIGLNIRQNDPECEDDYQIRYDKKKEYYVEGQLCTRVTVSVYLMDDLFERYEFVISDVKERASYEPNKELDPATVFTVDEAIKKSGYK